MLILLLFSLLNSILATASSVAFDTSSETPRRAISTGQAASKPIAFSPVEKHQMARRELSDVSRQEHAPWNLVLMSLTSREANLPTGRSRAKEDVYQYYPEANGEGIVVFLLNNGADTRNKDFGKRFQDFGDYRPPKLTLNGREDGVCVASIIGSSTFGVAKGVELKSVPVEDWEDVLAAFAQIINWHSWRSRLRQQHRDWTGTIISMSMKTIRMPKLKEWEEQQLVDLSKMADQAGILMIAGAGDNSLSSDPLYRWHSPCLLPGVICVGGINRLYNRWMGLERRQRVADGSNTGKAIHLWGPAEDVTCLESRFENKGTIRSGTAFAAASVVGAAAVVMSYKEKLSKESALFESVPRNRTFSLKALLLGASKQGWLNALTLESSRNLLVSSIVSSETIFFPQEELSLYNEEEVRSGSELEEATALPTGSRLRCFEPGTDDEKYSMPRSVARRLYLNLLWEQGHKNAYSETRENKGFDLVVPCYENACIMLHSTHNNHVDLDTAILERYVRRLVYNCDKENQYGVPITGGAVIMAEYPGLTLSLRVRI